jgi:hypothetical protein
MDNIRLYSRLIIKLKINKNMTRLTPTTPDITLADSSVVSVREYRFRPVKEKVIAIIDGRGRTILWSGDDYAAHASDTEEQLETQLKTLLDA